MNKEEYIKQCGVRTSKDLSNTQILSYFIAGNGGQVNRVSAIRIRQGRCFGVDIDSEKGISMLRQAFEQDKVLEIHFIESEGVLENMNNLLPSRFIMKIR